MRVIVSWSGGKDAALARRVLDSDHEVVGLLTELAGDRTKGHRLRPALVRRQADALDLPVTFVELPESPSNERYERALRAALAETDADALAYADLHLRDVRAYRESLLADTALDGVWPLWGRTPAGVLDEFLDGGAAVVCAADETLGPDVLGRAIETVVADLPDGVDPAGEGGEYHTFVTDGPEFDAPVAVTAGERTVREGHAGRRYHRDLRLA